MTELLKRWHALEPGRCLIEPPTSHLCASVMLGKASFLVPLDPPTPAQAAVLLAATIEAIEARKGWDWGVSYKPKLTEFKPNLYFAYVSTDKEDGGAGNSGNTPAAALLSAYLAALEAEAGQ